MTITLHQIDPKRNRQRFYTLQLAPDLFGEWSLIRSWGRIGTSGQQRTSWHASPAAADRALQHTLAQNQRRGYVRRPGPDWPQPQGRPVLRPEQTALSPQARTPLSLFQGEGGFP